MDEVGMLEGLAAVPPGPDLATLLAGTDPAHLPGDRVVEMLQAQARQCAHEQARLWTAMIAVGLAPPADDPAATDGVRVRAAGAADRATGELAAALTWTHRTAERELHLAEVVVRALPPVCAALSVGRIDRGKAVVFAEHLDPAHGLTAAQTDAILDRLLPVAPELTTSQLRGRLWRAVLAVDPEWARRRYARAVRGRAVTAVLADDGTVTVTGSGLPADEAAVACARVDRLAEAAKQAGHPGRVGQIAADVFLGLLDGRFHDRPEEQIIAALLREARPEAASTGRGDDIARMAGRPGDSHARSSDGGSTGGGGDTGGEYTAAGDAAGERRRAENARTGEPGVDEEPLSDEPRADEPGVDEPTSDEPGTDPPESDEPGPDRAGTDEELRPGIEVRVGLATLLGLDEHPGEIPGLGPILAPVARDIVGQQRRGAQWRFAVTDSDGYLILAGVTRRRPHHGVLDERSASAGGDAGRCRGGVVELHVPAAQLDRLAGAGLLLDERAADWSAVVADVAAQYADRHALLAGLDRRPGDRFPGAALARHIQVRDRTCSHPGCRRQARRCDLDHTRDHAQGGPTVRINLGPGCRRHHLFKHELGWRLTQPRPGRFVWTSPLGRVYPTRGEPITPPLPPPLPHPDEPDSEAEAEGQRYEGPILLLPEPRPHSETRPPPRAAEPDEPPPF